MKEVNAMVDKANCIISSALMIAGMGKELHHSSSFIRTSQKKVRAIILDASSLHDDIRIKDEVSYTLDFLKCLVDSLDSFKKSIIEKSEISDTKWIPESEISGVFGYYKIKNMDVFSSDKNIVFFDSINDVILSVSKSSSEFILKIGKKISSFKSYYRTTTEWAYDQHPVNEIEKKAYNNIQNSRLMTLDKEWVILSLSNSDYELADRERIFGSVLTFKGDGIRYLISKPNSIQPFFVQSMMIKKGDVKFISLASKDSKTITDTIIAKKGAFLEVFRHVLFKDCPTVACFKDDNHNQIVERLRNTTSQGKEGCEILEMDIMKNTMRGLMVTDRETMALVSAKWCQ